MSYFVGLGKQTSILKVLEYLKFLKTFWINCKLLSQISVLSYWAYVCVFFFYFTIKRFNRPHRQLLSFCSCCYSSNSNKCNSNSNYNSSNFHNFNQNLSCQHHSNSSTLLPNLCQVRTLCFNSFCNSLVCSLSRQLLRQHHSRNRWQSLKNSCLHSNRYLRLGQQHHCHQRQDPLINLVPPCLLFIPICRLPVPRHNKWVTSIYMTYCLTCTFIYR